VSTSKISILLGLIVCLLSAATCPAQQEEHHDEIIPKIKMDDVPIPDAIKHLARQAELNVILDPRVLSDSSIPPVSITFDNISAKEALDRILKIRRLVRVENPATTVWRIAPEKLGIKQVDPRWLKNDTNAVIPMIVMEDVPLRDALYNLARQIRWTVNFDATLKATPSLLSTPVSLRWSKLTGKQALIALLDDFDLTIIDESSDGVVRIAKKKASALPAAP